MCASILKALPLHPRQRERQRRRLPRKRDGLQRGAVASGIHGSVAAPARPALEAAPRYAWQLERPCKCALREQMKPADQDTWNCWKVCQIAVRPALEATPLHTRQLERPRESGLAETSTSDACNPFPQLALEAELLQREQKQQ